jgi:hypothetical protein
LSRAGSRAPEQQSRVIDGQTENNLGPEGEKKHSEKNLTGMCTGVGKNPGSEGQRDGNEQAVVEFVVLGEYFSLRRTKQGSDQIVTVESAVLDA